MLVGIVHCQYFNFPAFLSLANRVGWYITCVSHCAPIEVPRKMEIIASQKNNNEWTRHTEPKYKDGKFACLPKLTIWNLEIFSSRYRVPLRTSLLSPLCTALWVARRYTLSAIYILLIPREGLCPVYSLTYGENLFCMQTVLIQYTRLFSLLFLNWSGSPMTFCN